MAIYHTRVKTFSRAKQHSSAAAAAYRAGLLIEEADGKKHDYRRRGGVVETRCVAPEEAPDWAFDPRLLWPAAEASERRKDATVAREFEIALPHELDDDQRSALTAEIARALVDRYGFAVQASIHEPQTPDGLNYHVHILATTRRIGPDGLADKTRELDGGPSGRGEVEWIREMVAQATNAHLQAARIDARVDHRSLQAQADAALERGDLSTALSLTREPSQHVGKNATALHRKGVDCERTQVNQAIDEANEASFQAAIAELEGEGRLQAVPDGHSHAQARQERTREQQAPLDRSPVHGLGQIRVVRGLGRSTSPVANDSPLAGDPHQPTQDALAEAIRLWKEGFIAKVGATFKATSQLLQHGAERLSAFAHTQGFRTDLRELVKRLKRLQHDAMRFSRRMAAEDRTQHLLYQAELGLERFDAEHPKPGMWSRQEWSRRRARRLRALQTRRDAHRRARHATGPEAQQDYNAQARASAEHLEGWSELMLKRYPVSADKTLAAEADEGGADPEVPATLEPTKIPSGFRPK